MFKISEANALEEYSPSNQQYHKNDVNFKQSNVSQIQLELYIKTSDFSIALQLLKF